MYRCALCSLQSPTYETVDELEVHIAADHVNHVPYECERCRFSKFPTEYALISHCTADHGLREFYVKYKLTPDFHRKREKIKELLQHSVIVSKIPFRCYKRRRTTEASLLLGTGETYISLDSDEMIRMTETEKEAKAESVKGSEMEPEDNAAVEKESELQISTRPIATAAQNHQQVNIARVLGDLYPDEVCAGTTGRAVAKPAVVSEPSGADDPTNDSSVIGGSGEGISQQLKKRSKPPRTCTICGLQVTAQRSSLIYHANSKHLRLPMFFCIECKKTWTTTTKSDVIKHVKACHDGDESLIEDHRMLYANDVHEITDKCFPRKGRGGNADDELEGLINPELWIKSEESSSSFTGI